MSKIVTLAGVEIDEGTGVVVRVVDLLREKLEAAERGEICSIAMIFVDPADKICTSSAGLAHRHLLLAGTVYLQHDLTAD